MFKRKSKAFTLIELIATLVIMAIIALIVTPLVMNIIRKARISADKRSVDAYGRSIELAIAGYLLDTGKFPTEVSQLTIEYSDNQVVCSTTKINSNSSVYLAGCTVGGRSVDGYTYGDEETITYETYEVGDQVTYNNVDYYVIKDSDTSEESVTLLKAEPLSVQEVNTYGAGHVNRYTSDSVGTAYDYNGYGGMAYYTSETCGYVNNTWVSDGCKNDYASSEIKYVVDAWKAAKAPAATEARLITIDELSSLGYEWKQTCPTCGEGWVKTDDVPTWVYNSNYWYWTSTRYNDSSSNVWFVSGIGELVPLSVDIHYNNGYTGYGVVRAVITISKSALSE